MRRVYGVLAFGVVVLGVIHVALTPTVSDGSDAEALWFAGSGLFLIAAGALNLAMIRTLGADTAIAYSTVGVNLLGVLMAAWAIRAVGGLPAWVLLVLFGAAAVLGTLTRRSGSR